MGIQELKIVKTANIKKHSGMTRAGLWSVALLAAATLASCGGGGGDDSDIGAGGGTDSGSSSGQQYPAGIWSGTSGGQTFFGIIDPGGATGTSGFYYFSRGGIDAMGFDGLYGTDLQTMGGRVTSNSGVYYQRPADEQGTGTFVTSIALTGTLSGRGTPSWTSANATFNGNYTNPSNSATRLQFTSSYDVNLAKRTANLSLNGGIQGAYRGSTSDTSGWGLYVDWAGRISGRSGSCQLYGAVLPQGTGGPFYNVTITLANTIDGTTCAQAGHNLSGRAIVRYSTDDVKTGLWLAVRSVSGTRNTFILDGNFEATDSTTVPRSFDVGTIATTTQVPAGIWKGTDPFSSEAIDMVVLANNQFLMYRNSGNGDVFYNPSNIGMETASGGFYSQNNIFWRRSTDTLYNNMHFAGAVATRTSLKAIYDDPSKQSANGSTLAYNGLPAAMSLTPAATSAREVAFVGELTGQTYRSTNSAGFGSQPRVTSITIGSTANTDGSYPFSGTASGGCTVKGAITPIRESIQTAGNMFSVSDLSYSVATGSTSCSQSGTDTQSGVLIVDLNASNQISAVRVLTASGTGFTIFLGQP